MGFRFNKRIKICKGVSLNIGKKGINSVSVGNKGSRVNIGKKGIRKTVGIPGTGLSYTDYQKYGKSNNRTKTRTQEIKNERTFNEDLINNKIIIEDILSAEEIARTKYTKYNKFVLLGCIICGIFMFPVFWFALIEIPLLLMLLGMTLFSKRFRYVLYIKACRRALKNGFIDAGIKQVNRALKNGYDVNACNKIIDKIESLQ